MGHAKLSASESKRWMNCPGSIRLTEQFLGSKETSAGRRSSHYADLGTAAHFLADTCLKEGTLPTDYLGRQMSVVDGASWAESFENITHEVDQEMADAVQVYLDTVLEYMGRWPDSTLKAEQKMSLEWLRKDMWGTCDCVVYSASAQTLVVIDYKHGQGVRVEAPENSQLMFYAVGAAHQVGWAFEKVELVIVQPRHPHPQGPVRRWETTKARLLQFSAQLAEAADATAKPDAKLVPGDHCHFCPAASACPVLKEEAFKAAQMEFTAPSGPPAEMSAEDLSERMHLIPLLDAFIKACEGELAKRLTNGMKVPGFKLVEKKSRREWQDERLAEQSLTSIFGPAALTKPTLLSPAQMEKLRTRADGLPVEKKYVLQVVAALTHKKSSGVTVVDEGDPRPEVDPTQVKAEVDFAPEGE